MAGFAVAAEALGRARKLMESPRPETLDRSEALLESACVQLAAMGAALRELRGEPELLAAAEDLGRRIRDAARLLEAASEYHGRWSRVLGSMTAGYGAGGEAERFIGSGSLSVRG